MSLVHGNSVVEKGGLFGGICWKITMTLKGGEFMSD